MKIKLILLLFLIVGLNPGIYSQNKVIKLTDNNKGRIFEGIGALSAGASSKLLADYPEEYQKPDP